MTMTFNHLAARHDALDECWEAVNALGGTARNAAEEAANLEIGRALAEIEKLGGMDPLVRRHTRNGWREALTSPAQMAAE